MLWGWILKITQHTGKEYVTYMKAPAVHEWRGKSSLWSDNACHQRSHPWRRLQRELLRAKTSTHTGILRGNSEVGVGRKEGAGKEILRSQEQREGDHGAISGAMISPQNGVGKPLEGSACSVESTSLQSQVGERPPERLWLPWRSQS